MLTVILLAELSDWLVNAFNGEWLRTEEPKPIALGFDGYSGMMR